MWKNPEIIAIETSPINRRMTIKMAFLPGALSIFPITLNGFSFQTPNVQMRILIRAFYKWEWRKNNIVNFTNLIRNCDFYVALQRGFSKGFLGFFLLARRERRMKWKISRMEARSFLFILFQRMIIILFEISHVNCLF